MKFQLISVLNLGLLAISAYNVSAQNNSTEAVPRLLGTFRLPNAAFLEAYVDQGDETSFIGDRCSSTGLNTMNTHITFM